MILIKYAQCINKLNSNVFLALALGGTRDSESGSVFEL